VTEDVPEDHAPFPWPDPQRLVNDFIPRAELIESGRYLKLRLLGDETREISVWIADEEIARVGDRLRRDAREFYIKGTERDAVTAALAVDLFESLDSLRDSTTEIAFIQGAFRPLD
jgi:hypothetical protein